MSMTLSGDGTITGLVTGGLPDATITQPELASGVAGTGPAFSAYQSSAQTLPTNTNTKIQFQTEEFDTNNCFDNSTNYRFTPNVAGYYQINAVFTVGASYTTGACYVFKNGSNFKYGAGNFGSSSGLSNVWAVNVLVYCNGSTDYIEIYAQVTTGQSLAANASTVYFQGVLVRAA